MDSQTLALRVAGTVFGLVCLVQIWRYMMGVQILADGHEIPMWISAIAAVVLGGLSYWMWRTSSMHGSHPQ